MFKESHPVVNLIYFTFVLVITMFSNDPAFCIAALILAWGYSMLLKGKGTMKNNLLLALPVFLLVALINTLFTHNGATVLFYINSSRITLEALIFGLTAAAVLTAVIIWFMCFSEIMSSDKLIYIFGKARPVMGLTMSMIFRFIPLLRQRFREIQLGQKCMGREEQTKLVGKIRQFAKEVSILISWSLEAAIETSDSMEARGYGLKGRTSFHLFKITPRDKRYLAIITGLAILPMICLFMGETSITYYPEIVLKDWTAPRIISLISYIMMMSTPIVIDITGNKKWQLFGQTN